MYRLLWTIALAGAMAGLGACGGSAPEEAPATPARPATQPAPTGAPTTPSLTSTVTYSPDTLVGTAWLLGDFEVEFLDEDSAFVRGGRLEDLAPDGLEVSYSLDDGVLEATVMGQTRTGTWDGTTLVIDGQAAVPR